MNLVYFSPVPWNSFSQRPHMFVRWFHARHTGRVLWLDPYSTRLPNVGDIRVKQLKLRMTFFDSDIPRWLTVSQPIGLPVEPLPIIRSINRILWHTTIKQVKQFLDKGTSIVCIGKPSRLACEVLSLSNDLQTIYDMMDNFPAFYSGISRSSMRYSEEKIIRNVKTVLVSSTYLHQRLQTQRKNIFKVLNACSLDQMSPVGALVKRADNTVLGYIGTIGKWFDWSWVITLAKVSPNSIIRLIGPLHSRPSLTLPKNVVHLPACSHSQAILEMEKFTVGLIPFKRSCLTRSIDPIKYYEYRAMGVPVLATSFGEMAIRKAQAGVFLTENEAQIKHQLSKALLHKDDPKSIERFRVDNSWSNRFDSSGIVT